MSGSRVRRSPVGGCSVCGRKFSLRISIVDRCDYPSLDPDYRGGVFVLTRALGPHHWPRPRTSRGGRLMLRACSGQASIVDAVPGYLHYYVRILGGGRLVNFRRTGEDGHNEMGVVAAGSVFLDPGDRRAALSSALEAQERNVRGGDS